MNQPSSKYLTHPYPIWEGCTLTEIILVSSVSLSVCFIILFILGMMFHHVHLLLLGMIPAFLILPKLIIRQLAELKKDRPHGFALIHFRLLANKYVSLTVPYLSRTGHWSTKQ